MQDLDVLEWRQLGDLHHARDEVALANSGGALVAVGGYSEAGYWTQLEQYNRDTNTWLLLDTDIKEQSEITSGQLQGIKYV